MVKLGGRSVPAQRPRLTAVNFQDGIMEWSGTTWFIVAAPFLLLWLLRRLQDDFGF